MVPRFNICKFPEKCRKERKEKVLQKMIYDPLLNLLTRSYDTDRLIMLKLLLQSASNIFNKNLNNKGNPCGSVEGVLHEGKSYLSEGFPIFFKWRSRKAIFGTRVQFLLCKFLRYLFERQIAILSDIESMYFEDTGTRRTILRFFAEIQLNGSFVTS